MGWNSWDCFGVSVTEAEVRANAEFMARHLRPCGWEYIVVDLGWYAPDAHKDSYKRPGIRQWIDGYGRLVPDPAKFPSSAGGRGFRPLADYVHGLGLKFGVHLMRGIPVQAVEANTSIRGSAQRAAEIADPDDVCFWYQGMQGVRMVQSGGQAYYDSVAALLAEWGVDFVKVDDINSWDGEGRSDPYHTDEVEGVARALARCGRPIVLSLSPGAARTCNAAHLRRHANLWRISADFWDDWQALKRQFERCARWAPYATPGGWPDADMLPIGRIGIRGEVGEARATHFTPDEQTTLLTLWCIARSPLMFGGHLPESDELSLRQITNPEAMAVNQASEGNRELWRRGDQVAWVARVPQSSECYLALFNLGERRGEVIVSASELGLAGPCLRLRDLWARADTVTADGVVRWLVAPHGAALLRVGSGEEGAAPDGPASPGAGLPVCNPIGVVRFERSGTGGETPPIECCARKSSAAEGDLV